MPLLRRPVDKVQLLISFGIAIGLVLIVGSTFFAETGRDAEDLPAAIKQLDPAGGDEVLRQSSVTVFFEPGYTGELAIAGVALPTQEVTAANRPVPGQDVSGDFKGTLFDPGSFTLTYQPSEDAPIPRLPQGTNTVTVVYWKIIEGRETARSYSWQFEVSA